MYYVQRVLPKVTRINWLVNGLVCHVPSLELARSDRPTSYRIASAGFRPVQLSSVQPLPTSIHKQTAVAIHRLSVRIVSNPTFYWLAS